MTPLNTACARAGARRILIALATLGGLVASDAKAEPCDPAPTTTAWIACRARATGDARLCGAIADSTLVHFCTAAAGQGGCDQVRDEGMNRLCLAHVEIR